MERRLHEPRSSTSLTVLRFDWQRLAGELEPNRPLLCSQAGNFLRYTRQSGATAGLRSLFFCWFKTQEFFNVFSSSLGCASRNHAKNSKDKSGWFQVEINLQMPRTLRPCLAVVFSVRNLCAQEAQVTLSIPRTLRRTSLSLFSQQSEGLVVFCGTLSSGSRTGSDDKAPTLCTGGWCNSPQSFTHAVHNCKIGAGVDQCEGGKGRWPRGSAGEDDSAPRRPAGELLHIAWRSGFQRRSSHSSLVT